MTIQFPTEALGQHMAFLGKTGSGKTSTAKLAVEQILRDDPSARICVLDAIKSDWWGLTSSADGGRAGFPFYILGGPHKHVDLHPSAGRAIGELVASGELPLSIIDMADFPAGGLQQFFNEFAPALLRRMRGVVHLILEEAHEFAPKERAGIGAETMAIYHAKKLATAGRSKGIRMMVVTQRTQSLHNALLGSCDTMVAHRLTSPADQDPVKKWLKANVSKEIFEKVSSSLASLKTGSGWLCSGEAQVAELVQFPKITTFDNSKTPTGKEPDQEVKTAPVDRARLRSILGAAVKDDEENDVVKLRAEIARLKAAAQVAAPSAPSIHEITEADQHGFRRGQSQLWNIISDRLLSVSLSIGQIFSGAESNILDQLKAIRLEVQPEMGQQAIPPAESPARSASLPPRNTERKPSPAAGGDGTPSPTVRKILDVVHRAYPVALSFDAAARRAAVSKRSSAYTKYRSLVEASPEVTIREDGRFVSAGEFAKSVGPGSDPIEEFAARLPPSYARMLKVVAAAKTPLTKEQVAAGAEVSPTSSGLTAGLAEIQSLGLVQKIGPKGAEKFAIHEDLR